MLIVVGLNKKYRYHGIYCIQSKYVSTVGAPCPFYSRSINNTSGSICSGCVLTGLEGGILYIPNGIYKNTGMLHPCCAPLRYSGFVTNICENTFCSVNGGVLTFVKIVQLITAAGVQVARGSSLLTF